MITTEIRLRRVCRNYEQVENYEKAIADKEQLWDLHHRRETDEMKSAKQLKDEGRYYDVEPEELIFLTHAEHTKLHNTINPYFLGKQHSEETKQKMREARALNPLVGEKNGMYGKHLSEEAKKKLSEAKTGENNPFYGKSHTEETRKKLSEAAKLRVGEKNPRYGKHLSEETKKKLSEAHKGKKDSEETRKKKSAATKGENNPMFGKRCWNNGIINKMSKECPGEGFVRGKLKSK